MAVTQGHGNPDWTRDEVILALDLYHECKGQIPPKTDKRVKALSELLRVFPDHLSAARNERFRNVDGVTFKLQNLRQVAIGKGLGHVSRTDREVWNELGNDPQRTQYLARLIRAGVAFVDGAIDNTPAEDEFSEGRVVTETHLRRERAPRLRQRLIAHRLKVGPLACDICACAEGQSTQFGQAIFEAHHVVPLSAGEERRTLLKDLALLCANCHRMVHRAIAYHKRWLTIDESRLVINGASS